MILSLLFSFSIPLSIIILIVILIKSPSKFHKYILFYAVTMGMLGYCFMPTYEIDLSRYFKYIEYCRTLPFAHALDWADDGLFVKNLLFWLISKLGDNHILPLFSVGTIYGIGGYIIADSAKDCPKRIKYLLLCQIMLFPTFSVVSNVRNVTAFSLIILAVYRDMVQNKKNISTLLMYILPCFIHMTGVIMVLIRISIIFVKRFPLLGMLLTLGIPSAAIYVFEKYGGIDLPGSIGKIISRIIFKAYTSSVNTSEYAISWQSSGYFRACRLVLFILCLIIVVHVLAQLKNTDKKWYDYKMFVGIISAITMVWIVLGTVKYWVFAFAVILSFAPVLIHITDLSRRDLFSQIAIFLIPMLTICRFLLEAYYVRHRIDFQYFFSEMFTTNIYFVMFKALRYLMLGSTVSNIDLDA